MRLSLGILATGFLAFAVGCGSEMNRPGASGSVMPHEANKPITDQGLPDNANTTPPTATNAPGVGANASGGTGVSGSASAGGASVSGSAGASGASGSVTTPDETTTTTPDSGDPNSALPNSKGEAGTSTTSPSNDTNP